MIFNFGSINIDYTYRVPYFVRPGETLACEGYSIGLGGKGANQSVAIARAQGKVAHCGRLSTADGWVLDELKRDGVDVTNVELTNESSGHAIIQTDVHGENAILLFPGANHGFTKEQMSFSLLRAVPGDMLLIQNECNGLEELIPLAIRLGCRIVFNPAPMTSQVSRLPLEQCDLLFFNRTEAALLTAQPIESDAACLLRGLKERLGSAAVVLTLGSKGAWYQCEDEVYFQAAFNVCAVDTTAAGDTFVGYYLAARQTGLSPQHCLQRATAAAALAVQQHGAATSIPTVDEVDSFMT